MTRGYDEGLVIIRVIAEDTAHSNPPAAEYDSALVPTWFPQDKTGLLVDGLGNEFYFRCSKLNVMSLDTLYSTRGRYAGKSAQGALPGILLSAIPRQLASPVLTDVRFC